MSQFVLAIDQGTTGSTCAIFSSKGDLIAKANKEYEQIYPKPGWVEHNPEDIWQSVLQSLDLSLQQARQNSLQSLHDIAAIGITNQRETVVLWDAKTGKAVHNAIVWQCRRTAEFCLKHKKQESFIRRKTGLVLDPYFSASKVAWILDQNKSLRKKAEKGEILMGTIDTYLIWRLTNGQVHATDVTNASRTSLMNIKKCMWDQELLEFFNIPEAILPEIKTSSGVFGVTSKASGLPDGIPIAGVAGDQQAALFGQACFKEGEAKCTFGTGSFLLLNIGNKFKTSRNGLLTTVAWQLEGDKFPTYAFEGSAFICGAAVQWLRDQMQFVKSSAEIEELALKVDSTEGVEFVPSFTGLGAPYWNPNARAVICGMTRGTSRSHIARACLEGMALQNVDLLKTMEKDLGKKLRTLKVDGGAAANNLLMQMQCDFMGTKVVRPMVIETTAAGAAFLAGLGVGLWSSKKEISQIWQEDQQFKVNLSAKKRSERLSSWHKAIKMASL